MADMQACPRCAAPNDPAARFCGACGGNLTGLDVRDRELELEQLILARKLREQTLRRDHELDVEQALLARELRSAEHAFARDAAVVAERERRDELAARGASLEVTAARRADATRAVYDELDFERRRREAATGIELRRTAIDAELAELRVRRDSDLDDRRRRELLELELSAAREVQQLDKLRAMAELDRQIAADDHARDVEKRKQLEGLAPDAMVAMQAAELARAPGGAALAAAFAERRHTDEIRALLERTHAGGAAVMDRAMSAMAEVARSRAEAAPVVAATPVVAVTREPKE